MKQSIKGAIAAAAAGVLLLGGAGTIAYWSGTATIAGEDITTGTLSLTPPVCGAWTYAVGAKPVTKIVPGDIISKVCTFNIVATGDNLKATLDTPGTAVITTKPDTPSFNATVGATYTLDGGEVTAITSENNGEVVSATITVTFPFNGTPDNIDNKTQNVVATLAAIPVTLTQVTN